MIPEPYPFAELFKNGKCIDLEKGEVFHRTDEKCRAMGLVLSGEIRLSRMLSTGKEISLKDFREGDLYAELIVFTGEPYPGWLIASETSRVIEVKQSRVIEFFGGNDRLLSYLTGISKKMAHLSRTIEVLSMKTVRQKIAFALLNKEAGYNGISLNISRFAVGINCSREAVSRELSAMESEGLLKRGPGYLSIQSTLDLEGVI